MVIAIGVVSAIVPGRDMVRGVAVSTVRPLVTLVIALQEPATASRPHVVVLVLSPVPLVMVIVRSLVRVVWVCGLLGVLVMKLALVTAAMPGMEILVSQLPALVQRRVPAR